MIGKVLLLAVASLCAFSVTAADTYPTRPIRMVLSNGPGSAGDILGRIAFMRAAESLGQQIVVDNRTGAGGTIAVEIVARAAPDGYTLLATSFATHSVAPHTYKSVPYHPINDFAPISLFAITQAGLCVNAALPVKSTRELIDLARARPGQLLMASAGVGSTSHLAGLMFASAAGVNVTHVPYKGGGPSAAALAAGEANWTLGPIAAYAAPWKSGRPLLRDCPRSECRSTASVPACAAPPDHDPSASRQITWPPGDHPRDRNGPRSIAPGWR